MLPLNAMSECLSRLPGRIVGSEAHLAPAQRRAVRVGYFPKSLRSGSGVLVFWCALLLNEARGMYFVSEVWRHVFR